MSVWVSGTKLQRERMNLFFRFKDEARTDADSKFDALLSDPENQYRFQLEPGKLLSESPVASVVVFSRLYSDAVFDNWRMLHGRTAFSGKRRMCGGYIGRDDFISKYRMLNLSEAEIRESTVTG